MNDCGGCSAKNHSLAGYLLCAIISQFTTFHDSHLTEYFILFR